MRNHEVGGFDADFLLEWTNAEIPVKRVAQIAGVSIHTVHAYRHGRIRIPMSFWRDLFTATNDLRIAGLLLGNSNYELFLNDRLPDLGSDVALIKQALESIERFHTEQTYFTEIAKDGRIDETDRDAMKHYREHFVKSRMQSLALFRAVNDAFEKSVAAAM